MRGCRPRWSCERRAVKPSPWRSGNRVRLLENGEEYFPRVFEAIEQARSEVLLETYILFDDPIGRQLRDRLVAAARRGVRVELTVDGHGSADLPPGYISALTTAGVHFHVFDPQPKLFGLRINPLRRLHRKQVVIDGRTAFIGGMNFSHDHVRDSGAEAKQDYAVEVAGPVVDDVRRILTQVSAPDAPQTRPAAPRRWWQWWRAPVPPTSPGDGSARAILVTRDNRARRNHIERHYRAALRGARREIIIANAYFFPGYRLLRALRKAARRGVAVHLILQGKPDVPIMREAAITLYDYLLRSGVRIYEYCERPFHGKVAVIDEDWATVGSSNLDPLSLALNLEANLIVRDPGFAQHLAQRLHHLIRHSCKAIGSQDVPRRTIWRQLLGFFIFHFLRRFPVWASWLPAHIATRRKIAVEVSANDAEPARKKAA